MLCFYCATDNVSGLWRQTSVKGTKIHLATSPCCGKEKEPCLHVPLITQRCYLLPVVKTIILQTKIIPHFIREIDSEEIWKCPDKVGCRSNYEFIESEITYDSQFVVNFIVRFKKLLTIQFVQCYCTENTTEYINAKNWYFFFFF